MKFFATFLVASVFVVGCFGAVDHELRPQLKDEGSRISSGADAKKNENLDFCWFDAIFHTQWIRCSCFVFKNDRVVTAASCVKDSVEHAAQYINITLPQAGGKPYEKQNIWTPIAFAGEKTFANDVAVIKLTTSIDPKNFGGTSAKVAEAMLDTTPLAMLIGKKVRICGNGRIFNNQTYPKNPQCTDMLVLDPEKCKTELGSAEPALVDGHGCLGWEDRDNNACPGDYGSPVYTYTPGVKPTDPVTAQKVVGMVVGSTNVRKGNAPCKDGHILFFIPTVVMSAFINDPTEGNTNPPLDS